MRITSIDTTQILLLLLKPNQAFLSISSEHQPHNPLWPRIPGGQALPCQKVQITS